MQDQTTSSQPDAREDARDAPQQETPRRDQDGTWGLGSASAMDNLRRRNFRGRRPQPGDDKPHSH